MAHIIVENYDSLNEYVNVITARKPNEVFRGKELSSVERGSGFSMTASYEEATEISLDGYREGLEDLTRASVKIAHRENHGRAIPTQDVVGFVPHVPNAIIGIPKSMITKANRQESAKVLNIVYGLSVACNVETHRFVEAGKNLLGVIDTLETQGFRVGVYAMTSFYCNSEYVFGRVLIKHWRQPSNPLKMAYPMAHPSFYRRHGFRFLETVPNLTERSFPLGYGVVLSLGIKGGTSDRREWFADKGILSKGWFYTEVLEAEKFTPDELIRIMGIK